MDYRICDCGGSGDCGYLSLAVQLSPGKIITKTPRTLHFSLYWAMRQLRINTHNALLSLIHNTSVFPSIQDKSVSSSVITRLKSSSFAIHPKIKSNIWIDFPRLLKLIEMGHFSKSCSLLRNDNTLILKKNFEGQIEGLKRKIIYQQCKAYPYPSQVEDAVISQYCADVTDVMLVAYIYKKPLVILGNFGANKEYYQFWDFSNPYNNIIGADYQDNEEHFEKFKETLNKKDCIRMFYTDFHWQAILPKTNPLCSKLTTTHTDRRDLLAMQLGFETSYFDFTAVFSQFQE